MSVISQCQKCVTIYQADQWFQRRTYSYGGRGEGQAVRRSECKGKGSAHHNHLNNNKKKGVEWRETVERLMREVGGGGGSTLRLWPGM